MGHDQGNVPLTAGFVTTVCRLAAMATFLLSAGTPTLHAERGTEHRCGLHQSVEHRGLAIQADGTFDVGQRPTNLPFFYDSPRGYARVHYTTTGPDAVPLDDVDGSGIPDYVEVAGWALDSAWQVEIGRLGYRPPPADTAGGGDAGGSGAVDIYLRDLSKAGAGQGFYGVTYRDRQLTSAYPIRYSCWMEADNDFSPLDRNASGQPIYATHGVEALMVTCAHEFFHVVQLAGYGDALGDAMYYELTATYMEYAVFPSIPDWTAYTKALLERPDRFPFSSTMRPSNGYPWGFAGMFLQDVQGVNIMRRSWELLSPSRSLIGCLLLACTEAGTTFDAIFCGSIMPALYATGSRALPTAPVVLPFAATLPELAVAADEQARPPSVITSGTVVPYEICALRYTIPTAAGESVDANLVFTYRDVDALVSGSSTGYTYTVVARQPAQPDDLAVDGTSWGIVLPSGNICTFFDGIRTRPAEVPFPQPLRLASHTSVFLPVTDAEIGRNAVVRLRLPSMAVVRQEVRPIEREASSVGVSWPWVQDLPPGVLIAEIELDGKTTMHKIVVRR